MKKILIPLFALCASAAVACAADTVQTTTTTTSTGTVSEYTPGASFVVKETSGPVTYRYGKKVTYVTRSGKTLTDDEVRTRIRVGVPVSVHYDMDGDARLINRVEIDDDDIRRRFESRHRAGHDHADDVDANDDHESHADPRDFAQRAPIRRQRHKLLSSEEPPPRDVADEDRGEQRDMLPQAQQRECVEDVRNGREKQVARGSPQRHFEKVLERGRVLEWFAREERGKRDERDDRNESERQGSHAGEDFHGCETLTGRA